MDKTFSILTALITMLACQSPSQDIKSSKDDLLPNFVIIFTDDQGYEDLGCYGSPDIRTPNIDAMAKEGLRFTNFYVSQPVCSASRSSLLTGCYANRMGIHGAYSPNAKKGLNPEEVTIAEVLKPLGSVWFCFHIAESGAASLLFIGRTPTAWTVGVGWDPI
jgi:arylsulfatase